MSDEVRKAKITFEVDRSKLDPALASITAAIGGVGGKGARELSKAFTAIEASARKAAEQAARIGTQTEQAGTKAKAAGNAATAAAREEAKARAEAAKQAKTARDAQVAGLKAEAAALREQQQVLRAIGGDAKQLHDLRMRELAILERAATVAGKSGQAQGFRSAQTVERVKFSEARSKEFGADLKPASDATKGLRDNLLAANGPAASVARSLGQMGLAAVGIGAVGGALGAVISAVDQLSAESLKAQRVSAGLQFSIEGAAKAFGGYVDNVSLAQSANKAYAMGVVQTGAEFEKLAKGVNAIALQFGEDATQLLDNAVTAVGRQSRLILDNLGIILDSEKAQLLYAESLGKTTAQLTSYEKEVSFSKAAMILISQAGDEAAISIDGMAAKAQQAKVALQNYRQGMLGFSDTTGKTREALRALSVTELKLIEDTKYHAQSIVDLDKALASAGAEEAYAAQLKKSVEQLTEAERQHAKTLVNTGVTFADVKAYADQLGVSYEKLIAIELKRRKVENRKQAQKEADADTRAKIKALRDQADQLDHMVDLRKVEGRTEKDNIEYILQALKARKMAADIEYKLTGELDAQTEALKMQRAIQLKEREQQLDKLEDGKKKGAGPTAADRIRAEGEARLQVMAAELAAAEQTSKLNADARVAEQERVILAERALAVSLETLAVERAALVATRAKNSVERTELATKIAALDAEVASVTNAAKIEAREHERDLITQATAEIRAKIKAENDELAAVHDISVMRSKAAGQRIEIERDAALQGAKWEHERIAIIDDATRKMHANRLKQIDAERGAALRELDVREQLLRAQSGLTGEQEIARQAELRKVEHDREMVMLGSEIEMRRAVADEQARLAAQGAAALQAQLATINTVISTIEGAHGQLAGIVSDYKGRAKAAESAEFDAWKAQQELRLQAQTDTLERERDAARGNAAKIADINRRKVAAERATQERIRKAQAAHDAQTEREAMRSEGIKLMIQGAVSTVKAAAAYPNIPEMIAQAAAAAMAFTYGGMLLSGNVPRAGGAAAGAGSMSGPGGSLGTAATDQQSNGAAMTPDSVPAGDRDRFRTTPAKSSGSTNVTVNLHTFGKVDADTIDRLARAVGDAKYQREGTGK